jgi:hypothetical protein
VNELAKQVNLDFPKSRWSLRRGATYHIDCEYKILFASRCPLWKKQNTGSFLIRYFAF